MLQTVKDICTLLPGALEIKVSDQIEQLDELINSEADGKAFYAKTHITQGMATLLREGLSRLAGKSNQAVFHLKQSMGGGKTHLLVGFGLLAKNPDLRQQVALELPDILHANNAGQAQVAAFNGRNHPAHFFWGEIASQLGKADRFKDFWQSGPKAPEEKDWTDLFGKDTPVLILMDELPPYFQYLDTQKTGNGTLADIATRALANMLSAAGKMARVCVVLSDLTSNYSGGGSLITRALTDARNEVGRQERNITPVDLAKNEIYAILRKRLFATLPTSEQIDSVAEHFGTSLAEATKAKAASRGAEAIAEEVAQTYPFHPRLKNMVALFKENEKFKQTRGLMELVSRLLKSVWARQTNDVYLIGPQHFDLSIPEVREKLIEISDMQDVVAKDLWDVNRSAHAQLIDSSRSSDAAAQVGALLLTASLSTAINSVKGLAREEIVDGLIMPNRKPSEFIEAFEQLVDDAWYLHKNQEERYYFDRQENLTKMLQSLAHDAPEVQVDKLIRERLQAMYSPSRKAAYSEVIPLPKLEDVVNKVQKGRVLLIVSPDSKLPPQAVREFFEGLTQKNNLCVLTGDKTQMASLEKNARQVYATLKADLRIPKGHAQRPELEKKTQQYEQDFNSAALSLFNKVVHPIQLGDKAPQLVDKTLDTSRDNSKPFNGEEQIEKTLTADPKKLFLDLEKDFDALRGKMEVLLWPNGQDIAPWKDIQERAEEHANMPWLPPKGLDTLKNSAIQKGIWEDLGNGSVTKKPKKKTTGIQVVPETDPNDQGEVRLKVSAENGGPQPRIYYQENDSPTTKSPILNDNQLITKAMRVGFLVVDPTGKFDNGAPYIWTNKIVIRNELQIDGGVRSVKLIAGAKALIRYSLDGSDPRSGAIYGVPIDIGDSACKIWVFAELEGVEAKEEFSFPAKGKSGLVVEPTKKATINSAKQAKKLDSRQQTYEGLKEAKDKKIELEGVTLTIGSNTQSVTVTIGELRVTGEKLEQLLGKAQELLEPDAPITLAFKKAHFASGHDLQEFAKKFNITLLQAEVQQ